MSGVSGTVRWESELVAGGAAVESKCQGFVGEVSLRRYRGAERVREAEAEEEGEDFKVHCGVLSLIDVFRIGFPS